MRRNWPLLLIVVLLITSCKKEVKKELALGDWRAEMEVSEGKSLPFNFTLSKDGEGNYIMKMYNAEEEVVVDEFNFDGDSINIRMPIFEGHISGTFTENEITGEFIEDYLPCNFTNASENKYS